MKKSEACQENQNNANHRKVEVQEKDACNSMTHARRPQPLKFLLKLLSQPEGHGPPVNKAIVQPDSRLFSQPVPQVERVAPHALRGQSQQKPPIPTASGRWVCSVPLSTKQLRAT